MLRIRNSGGRIWFDPAIRVRHDHGRRTDDEVAGAIDELLSRRLVADVADSGAPPGHGAYDFTHGECFLIAPDSCSISFLLGRYGLDSIF